MKRLLVYVIFVLCINAITFSQTNSNDKIDLSGKWQFQTDPEDKGLQEKWFQKNLTEDVKLPGSMTENGKGEKPTLKTQWTGSIYDSSWFFNPQLEKYRQPGNLKFSFWLTPDLYYVGAAWYQKVVEIPQNWKGKSIFLILGRPHWESLVWIDNNAFEMQNSLSVPHDYDLSKVLSPGKHTITIRIDNRIKQVNPGPDSHSITDHTQGNWNGIVGDLLLTAKNNTYLKDIQIYPDIKNNLAKVKMVIQKSDKNASVKLLISAETFNTQTPQKVKPLEIKVPKSTSLTDTIETTYQMGPNVQLWDEFNPVLYNLTISVSDKKNILDQKTNIFGMREIKAVGTRFFVNNKERFLRGTVENAVFPLTGYMPQDEASWTRVFRICKSFGLNHMRFHSVCPPEVAFIAADKAGFYLQPEGPSWANHGVSLGDGKPIDQYIIDETKRIVKEYGNHPSFALFAYGNEPKGGYVKFLEKWVTFWKNIDNRRLYTGASTGGSWKIIPGSDYLVRAKPRGLNWHDFADGAFDYRDNLEGQTIPYLSHEMGQWCVFPNFREISKYTGHLKAKNFEMFQENLADKNMGDLGNDFLMASGKLQALCYKAEIEAALRTPGLAGIQLLSLNDYPGQGTALVGILDAFWDEKGYISASEFNHFCNSVVPLTRIPKYTYKNNEIFKADIEIANFGGENIINSSTKWKITDKQGKVLIEKEFANSEIPVGNAIHLGKAEFNLKSNTKAEKLKLEVSVGNYSNSWEFWVYPAVLPQADTTAIYTCSTMDNKAKEILARGGKVLILAAGKVENGKDVSQYFTPVFWNTSWFKMRPPHTTGILVQDTHPLFNDFPTEYYSNYQWYELVNKQQVMNLDSFPADFKPIVEPIDTWFINRKLGLLFEANVDKGKVMVCSADLISNTDKRIVARQLYHSIINYMNSDQFKPKYTVKLPVISDLFEKKTRSGYNAYTNDSPDELKPDFKKKNK
jgi:hypothetical protein